MGKEERGHCLASYLFLTIVLCFSSVSKNWRSTFEILKFENMHITHNFLSHRNVSLSSMCLNSSLFQECTQCFCKENETFLFFKAKLIIACKLTFIVLLERERIFHVLIDSSKGCCSLGCSCSWEPGMVQVSYVDVTDQALELSPAASPGVH